MAVDIGLGSPTKTGPRKPSEQNRSRPEKVLRDLVYHAVKSKILDSHLRPAQRISEISVANDLGVSRTPAREALRRLEQEGWLILVPRQGYNVRAYSVREVDEVYDLRIAIERHTARTAAERSPHASLSRLRHKWEVLERRSDTMIPLEWLEADEAFHSLVAEATGNRMLVSALQRINERIRIIRRIDFTRSERAILTRTEHLEILDLIQARKPPAAAARMEQHILSSKESVKALAQIYFVEE